MTDITLAGTYDALIRYYVPGDTNSVCYLNLVPYKLEIIVTPCTPSGTIPPTLASETLNIGIS